MNLNKLHELQKRTDKSIDRQNGQEILNIINEVENTMNSINNINIDIKANLYYVLGNCYKELHDLKVYQENSIWDFEHKELFKSIYYYRKFISEKEFKNFDIQLKVGILTNLGNSFSHYGRPIEALRYFNIAIIENKKEKLFKKNNILYPNYFISLANKGLCLEYYSKIIYDYSHSDLFNKEAYNYLIEAIEKTTYFIENTSFDLNYDYYKNFKSDLECKRNNFEYFYNLDFLNEDVKYDEYKLSNNNKKKISKVVFR